MSNTNAIEVSGFETMAEAMEFADNYNHWILTRFRPFLGNSLLEVGTGQGNFKKYLDQKVSHYVSVDIDEQVIARARKRDPQGIYEVADISSSKCLELKSCGTFDSILCVNVLEHVPDHQSGLGNMLQLLNPNGHLLLFVPAFPHLFNDLDRLAGHLRRYTRQDIQYMLESCPGTELRVCEYFNPVGALGWFVNKLKKHENINSKGVNSQVRFFDRYLVPISKVLNPAFKHFWGQSLYCIIRRNGQAAPQSNE